MGRGYAGKETDVGETGKDIPENNCRGCFGKNR